MKATSLFRRIFTVREVHKWTENCRRAHTQRSQSPTVYFLGAIALMTTRAGQHMVVG